jgi:hypothetical protein
VIDDGLTGWVRNEGAQVNDPEQLRTKAAAVLDTNEPILAAGIFGLQDSYAALTAGGVLGGSVGARTGGGVIGDLGSAVGNVAGMHAARDVRAASQGVTVRMLIAVTATHIHVLDWVTGSGPTHLLRSLDRSVTSVHIKKFGLSRRVHLHDTVAGQDLNLTGTTLSVSAEAKGDKAVLAALI